MDFHAVEPCFHGIGCGTTKGCNDLRNFLARHGAGHSERAVAIVACRHHARGQNGGGSDGLIDVPVVLDQSTRMHNLQDDAPASGVDGIDDLTPSGNLFGRRNTRLVAIALALRGVRMGAFGDDQAEPAERECAVVFGHLRLGTPLASALIRVIGATTERLGRSCVPSRNGDRICGHGAARVVSLGSAGLGWRFGRGSGDVSCQRTVGATWAVAG